MVILDTNKLEQTSAEDRNVVQEVSHKMDTDPGDTVLGDSNDSMMLPTSTIPSSSSSNPSPNETPVTLPTV